MSKKIEISVETLLEMQKFIGYIDGFVSHNEKIDSKIRDRISDKIDTLEEMFDQIIF